MGHGVACGWVMEAADVLMMQFVLSPRRRRAHAGRGHPRHVRPLALLIRHTPQVGARIDRGGFFCLLFSSGSPNSTFLLEAIGRGKAAVLLSFGGCDMAIAAHTQDIEEAEEEVVVVVIVVQGPEEAVATVEVAADVVGERERLWT
ncbi:uncharacterized protein LOC125507920 [Triticum urartu]|uniref:uncharacterized protein LOC125507920 n=1 Tax=Triticum urartu TaxID=4572 RepID=UPI0020436CFC|nr:uncharacterized protein LOC125507920 [Triticum urartu]